MKHIRDDYNDRIQDNENKIPKDMPVMLFLAKDKHFCQVLRYYAWLLRMDENEEMADAVIEHVLASEIYRSINGCKKPDMPVQTKLKLE